MRNKLQNLLTTWPQGGVTTSQKLQQLGISRSLVQKYKQSGWVSSVGVGAFIRPHDKISWPGAVNALQSQLGLHIHVGGKTALELQGHGHFIDLGQQTIDLLRAPNTRVPRWFTQHPWEEKMRVMQSQFLPDQLETDLLTLDGISVIASTRERAFLELLQMTPRYYDPEEVLTIIESLGSLRPEVLSQLLENCHSEKVKRLTLFLGDVLEQPWRLKLSPKCTTVDTSYLLKTTTKDGKYVAAYNLVAPQAYYVQKDTHVKF